MTLIDSTADAPPGGPRPRPAWRFWGAAYALVVLLAGTNIPTPLYRGYQREFGFSPLTVTLIFGVYVTTLIPALLIAGPLSDAIGRRRVLLPAVGLAAIGTLTFALADGTTWLFAARVLQGAAMGAASGVLTAVLTEQEPGGDRRRAALVTTAASVGGMGAGPLLSGLLAQYAPAPRVLAYLVELVLLTVAAVVVAAIPEQRTRTPWRPRRPKIPGSMRRVFATAGTASFLAFMVNGLFLTLVPTYVGTLSGSGNLALSGGAATLMLGCSGIAQVAAYGRQPQPLLTSGLALLAGGLVLLAVAGSAASLPLMLVATAGAGAGLGLTFLGALTEINQTAPADRRAEVTSSFYVIVYLGVGVPVIGVGFLATQTGLLPAVQWFACVAAALCLLLLTALVVRNRRDRSGPGRQAR
ncbi:MULTISPECIES: MFS transporter [Thermomonosporaceae]|uniref:MFS transporter n=1 Tax=Thermomonosporaceae TaxID=2012 RepID=UPI00255B314F|nr:MULTISPECIES: MFS transporter [Thermomonosporaceae]MDL4775144.1 MFS transporter [Actinomadura xylanilytica]